MPEWQNGYLRPPLLAFWGGLTLLVFADGCGLSFLAGSLLTGTLGVGFGLLTDGVGRLSGCTCFGGELGLSLLAAAGLGLLSGRRSTAGELLVDLPPPPVKLLAGGLLTGAVFSRVRS